MKVKGPPHADRQLTLALRAEQTRGLPLTAGDEFYLTTIRLMYPGWWSQMNKELEAFYLVNPSR